MADQLTQQQREALEALYALYADAIDGGFQPSKHALEQRKALKHYILNSTPVPEGWQLVPVEPTHNMKEAGVDRHWPQPISGERMALLYRAMLAAAPTPENEDD